MNLVSATALFEYSERDLLSRVLSRSTAQRQASAVWRLPGSPITHVLVSDNITLLNREDFLEDLDPGFLFAPFERTKSRVYLKADHLLTLQKGAVHQVSTAGGHGSPQWLSDLTKSLGHEKHKPEPAAMSVSPDQDQQSFQNVVIRALEQIETGSFEKIVPSRTKTINLPDDFDITEAFQKLCNAYPEALISLVSIPGIGTWLGASPELLVSVQDKSYFKTVALAGTQPYQPGTDIKSVAWTQKEIEEQALVERYVISCFKKVRLREYDEQGPRTVIAGNLMHLKSEFTVDMKATNFSQIGTVMLDLLHPTSAVCGMPLDAALQFLREHEHYDREFYAGYLGPVNIHNNIDLFVNIRCMQIFGTQGVLYAGVGITNDSIPEMEWKETEMKFQTLLNVIL